jgi:hypothetical protein
MASTEVPRYRDRQALNYWQPRRNALIHLQRRLDTLRDLSEFITEPELAELAKIADAIEAISDKAFERYAG